jgi:hypothetical protein
MEIFLFTLLNILTRLVPHIPNATGVGAGAVFAGSRYGLKKAWIVTLAALLITDLVRGLHPVMWATYGSFLAAAVIGKCIGTKAGLGKVIAAL